MSSPFYVYGELSLDGRVTAPEDWESLLPQREGILTGRIKEDNYLCDLFQISSLIDLANPVFTPVKPLEELLQKPPLPDNIFFF